MKKIKIGVWNFYESLNYDNFIFKSANTSIGDNLLLPFNLLHQVGASKNIVFNTLSVCDIENQDAFLFMDFPEMKNPFVKKAFLMDKPKFLMTLESELIRKENFCKKNHDLFCKIFTWSDPLILGRPDKYVKINLSHKFPDEIINIKKNKLCTLIAGNKKSNHPLELYSKRVEAIRWFEEHYPEDFDFYGVGWDVYLFNGPRYIRVLNRIKPLTKLLATSFSSYKGKVQSKKEVLEQYKFAICFENARDIPGYITEKIFDCFFAGCVPIYWGANNIKNHIPADCFIDFREFADFNALYTFLNEILDDSYQGYLDCINKFLKSDVSASFSSEYFADTIVNTLLKEIDVEA